MESHWSAFDAAGIQRLLAAEDRHFWFRARNQIIAALAGRPIADLADGFHILEIGCGSGNVLRVLQRLRRGAAASRDSRSAREAADVARARTGLTHHEWIPLGPRLPRHPSTSVAAFDVLEHIDDQVAVLIRCEHGCDPGAD